MRQVNVARNARIVELRLEGASPREIGRRLGVSAGVVAGVLNRAKLCNSGHDYHSTALRGEQAPSAKLTEEAARTIRAEYVKGSRDQGIDGLARRYGVNPNTIRNVLGGRTWAHVA